MARVWLHSLEVNEGIDCISNEFDCLYIGEDNIIIVHTSPKPSASIPDAKTMSERDKRVSSAACDTTRQDRHGSVTRTTRTALSLVLERDCGVFDLSQTATSSVLLQVYKCPPKKL